MQSSKLITTKDGSKTIHFPEWNESYHSQHGAVTEAMHVYIKSGLEFWIQSHPIKTVSVLEMGFGTGLNTYLTYKFGEKHSLEINYTAIEKYPVDKLMINQLNYVQENDEKGFNQLHSCQWEAFQSITNYFQLKKLKTDLDDFKTEQQFDVIYFDAFGPRVQPHLWQKSILQNMYNSLNSNGVWVTYCCKGSVRRDLMDIGFQVEKIAGPPGKREMLRAIKD